MDNMDSNKENLNVVSGEKPGKKPRLSLSLKKKRFAPPLTEPDMKKVCEGFTPKNTTKNTEWALKVFHEWQDQRDSDNDDKCPSDILLCPSAEKINYWLSRFVVECRRGDGNSYPAQYIIPAAGWFNSI